MDKNEFYLVVPSITLGFSMFLSVILSLLFPVSFLVAFLLSIIFVLFVIAGTFVYRKKKDLLSSEERRIENVIHGSIWNFFNSIKETFSGLYWRFRDKPVAIDQEGDDEFSADRPVAFRQNIDKSPAKEPIAPQQSNDDSSADIPVTQEQSTDDSSTDTKIEWNIDIIRNIEQKKFVELCRYYFMFSGLKAEQIESEVEDSADLKIYKPSLSETRPVAIAQCVADKNVPVEVMPLMELLGEMADYKVNTSFFLTNNQFSQTAIEFVASNSVIKIIDGEKILEKIIKLPEQKRRQLHIKIIGNN